MIRTLCLALSLLAAAPVAAQPQAGRHPEPPARSDVRRDPATEAMAARLWSVLHLADLMPILRDEAMAEAEAMESEMFEGGEAAGWQDAVAAIHAPDRLQQLFRTAAAEAVPAATAPRVGAAIDFYAGDLGQRLIGLETSARQAMLDPETEDAARQRFSEAASREDPRVAQITRLIDEADLIGPNVAGGLNAAVAFSQGFAEGGGFDMPLSESQMLADAWTQEPGIHAETLGWMEAYLLLAYSPLSDAELDRYIRFAGSDAGQALSGVLFAGFDALFLQTSRDLGRAAARQLQGRAL